MVTYIVEPLYLGCEVSYLLLWYILMSFGDLTLACIGPIDLGSTVILLGRRKLVRMDALYAERAM